MAATVSDMRDAAGFKLNRGAYAKMQTLRHAVTDGDLRGVAVGPPFPCGHLVALGRCVGPTQFGVFQHAAGIMLVLHLLHGLAVEGDETAPDDGHQIELLTHAGLLCEERFHARDFVGAHVNKKNVGQFGRGGLAQIAQEALLHEIDREDEHDSRAQRRQHRGRLIAGTVEIGQAHDAARTADAGACD